MALPNKPKGEIEAVVNPEVVEHSCDVLMEMEIKKAFLFRAEEKRVFVLCYRF